MKEENIPDPGRNKLVKQHWNIYFDNVKLTYQLLHYKMNMKVRFNIRKLDLK